MRKIGRLRGSFTLEAALLMTLLLPVLFSLIYASFFLHDRTILQGAACEVAAMVSNLTEEKDEQSRLEKLKDGLISSRLLGTKGTGGSLRRSKDQVSVSYQGNFPIPGLTAKLFGKRVYEIREEWSRKLYHPADIIRKIRGLEYVLDVIER